MIDQRGFTLLEMLVVMLLLGLVTSLALPAMQRWHDAVQHKAQAAAIVDTLRAAGFKAGAERRDIKVDSDSFQPAGAAAAASAAAATRGAPTAGPDPARDTDARAPADDRLDKTDHLAMELPVGWKAERVDDIRFLANGLCRPGSVLLRTARSEPVRLVVHGPLCGVELAGQPGTATP